MNTKAKIKMVIPLPWYGDPLAYRVARAVMADKNAMPAKYSEWLKAATRGVEMLEANGNAVLKIGIPPGEFMAWCRRYGHDTDATARQKFASAMAELDASEDISINCG